MRKLKESFEEGKELVCRKLERNSKRSRTGNDARQL